jgi:hypothetical protein
MGLDSPLSGLEAYYKVRELRGMGFKAVSLRNVETGEEITDIAALVRDSPMTEGPREERENRLRV